MVQPIAVLKTGTHWATIKAAAAASALAYLTEPTPGPEWEAWLGGPFAKSVRRADQRALVQVRQSVPHVEVQMHGAVAVATRPYAYAELPRPLARLQVAGTDLPREEVPRCAAPLFVVRLAASLDMTTGKSAAQAAHAVFSVVRDVLSPDDRARWLEDPSRFDVVAAGDDDVATSAVCAPVVIRDAGHTEIAPGSLTATADLP